MVTPEGEEYLTEGTAEGLILRERRGSDGFGYDPLFYVPEFAQTMAELTLNEKNKLSHRARAFREMIQILKALKERQEKAPKRN